MYIHIYKKKERERDVNKKSFSSKSLQARGDGMSEFTLHGIKHTTGWARQYIQNTHSDLQFFGLQVQQTRARGRAIRATRVVSIRTRRGSVKGICICATVV